MANLNLPKTGWVLVDTNFLIDFFSKKQFYSEFLKSASKSSISIVSIEPVRVEFIRSKNKDVVRQKSDFFIKVVEALLPLDQEVFSLVQPTDIFLACAIQRYSQVYLLTRNHQDFPTKLFKRSNIFNIETEKDVKTYALYQYIQPEAKEISF
ncbi:MAG: hypothetical protein G01um101416_1225 [Microgenomates group bacterium Gr01-1014_16]|nr:MAG: hypothetical protein G01um101416_1225 [Microgenomates group bacterium Gr01-1014_16]